MANTLSGNTQNKQERSETMDTKYQLIDTKTQKVMGVYSYAQRNRARARRDKLDLEYGAIRYILKPIFN